MKLTIYILCSVLLSAAGVILLLLPCNNEILSALALSFIGSGLTSIAFTLIKYFDDKDTKSQSAKMLNIMNDVSESLTYLSEHKVMIQDVDGRCIFDRHITSQFNEELQHINQNSKISIDIMGLSLIRFYQEQLKKLLNRKNLKIRIIVQDPDCTNTQVLINQEGRSLDAVREDIYALTREITKLNETSNIDIEMRWFQGYPSVTLTRINGAMYVRPRFLDEAKDAPVLFERYSEQYPKSFHTFVEYFENTWNKSNSISE